MNSIQKRKIIFEDSIEAGSHESEKTLNAASMLFLKIVHIYLTAGALAACYFGFMRREQTILPFIVAVAVTIYLVSLFFICNRALLFNSLLSLFLLQLVSIKTAAFGFIFSLGFGLYIQIGIVNFSARQYLATLSSIDFSTIETGDHQMAGGNLLAFITLLFLLLAKEKKY